MFLRLPAWAVLGVWVLLSGFLLTSAYRMYPTPDIDAAAFLPQAVNLVQGRGLVNPLFNRVVVPDPEAGGRQYYYPPLFGLAVAALMPEPNARGAFLAVALLDVVALLLAARLFLLAAPLDRPDAGPRARLLVLLACLALAGLAGHMKNGAGRPETLGTIFMVAAALLALRRPVPGAGTAAVAGVLLGLMGATHPFGGVLLGCMIAGYVARSHAARSAAPLLLLVAAVAALAFGLVLMASGTDIRLLLRGLAENARLSVLPTQVGVTYWEYYVAGVRFPLIGGLLLAAAAVALAAGLRHHSAFAWAAGVWGAALAALAVTGYLTLRTPSRYYNLAMIAPLAYAILLAWTARRPYGGATWHRFSAVLLTLLFLGTASGFGRRLLLYGPTVRETRSWEEARADFERLPPDAPVLLTQSLWVLSEDYDRMQLDSSLLPCHYALFLQQQASSRLLHPPELPGHTRIFSSFAPERPRVLGLSLGRSVGGYGFAAYVPTPEQRRLGDCTPRD